jgi:hypothetical protein
MKSMMFHRVGGLSPIKQKGNDSAPAKYGFYAFIWPYVEPFLLGATNDNGIATQKDHLIGNTRYHQMKREGLRKFAHNGRVWTRFSMGRSSKNGWCLTDTEELSEFVSKFRGEFKANCYSKDCFEVFIERIVT